MGIASKAFRFIRVRGRIIAIKAKIPAKRIVSPSKVLKKGSTRNIFTKRNKTKKIISSKSSLSEKRISAIKSVREAIRKRKQARSVIDKLELKSISINKDIVKINKIRDGVETRSLKKLFSSKNKVTKFLNEMLIRKNKRGKFIDIDDASQVFSKAQVENFITNKSFRDQLKNPVYKGLTDKSRSLNRRYNDIEKLSQRIKDNIIPHGATAKTTILKNKVIKTNRDQHDLIADGIHLNIEERAKVAITLAKNKLAPETFLVKTSKRTFKVQDKVKIPSYDKITDKIELNLESSIHKRGFSAEDVRFENIGKIKKRFVTIDTGQFAKETGRFKTNMITGARNEIRSLPHKTESISRRIKKFTIESRKRKK